MAVTSTPTVAVGRRACRAASEPRQRRVRPTQLAPNDRAGAWRVERDLGQGGMASVYAVVHTRFGKRAALKLAHRSILSEQFTAATFLREARIVNMIDHPGVPDVFGTGTYDRRPYLVMERLAGHTLGELVDAGSVDRAQAIEILLELCDVLGAAHRAGVVHRDLKLDNVFVLETPAGERKLKLLDWGVAAVVGEPDPMCGMIAGTLTYVAPEQMRGDDISPAADVYSLAVLAFQLLFGRPPFQSRRELELIRMHLHEPPPAPETLWPEIPRELAALLGAMLAKRPEDRPLLPEIVGVLERSRTTRGSPGRYVRYPALGVILGLAVALASLRAALS